MFIFFFFSSSEVVIEDNLSEQRDLIKKESFAILKSNGVSNKKMEIENLVFDQSSTPLTQSQSSLKESPRSSSGSMVEAVDSMLDNVNQIMYQISDPGSQFDNELVKVNGEVKTVYDCYDDTKNDVEEEKEVVQSYLVFDQSTRETSSIIKSEENSTSGKCLFCLYR